MKNECTADATPHEEMRRLDVILCAVDEAPRTVCIITAPINFSLAFSGDVNDGQFFWLGSTSHSVEICFGGNNSFIQMQLTR